MRKSLHELKTETEVTVSQAADYLQCHEDHVSKLCRTAKLKARKVKTSSTRRGVAWLIERMSLAQHVKNTLNGPGWKRGVQRNAR